MDPRTVEVVTLQRTRAGTLEARYHDASSIEGVQSRFIAFELRN